MALPLHAQSVVQQIHWEGADGWMVAGFFALLSAVGGVFVAVHYYRLNQMNRDKQERVRKLFDDNALRCELTDSEREQLLQMIATGTIAEPHTIFQSALLFEQCIHKRLQAISEQFADEAARTLAVNELASIRKKLGFDFLPQEHPLVSTRTISLGQRGSLFGANGRQPLIHRASVVANDEMTLTLQYDAQHEEAFDFRPGHRLRFAFARNQDGFYGVELTVSAADNAGMLQFDHTMDMKRNQLRQYVRIEASIPLKLRLLRTVDVETSEVKPGDMVECKVSDISGGGMSFLSSRSLRAGDAVSLNFALPECTFAGVGGRVLRISLQEGKTQALFRHHVEFTSIATVKRERIIKFVFERQRQVSQWR
jgi:c-di-GMP-binding flagellar brake protein YcgR